MRSKKRLTLIVLMIMTMLACIIGAVACGGESAKDAIEMYILPQNQTLVDEDFSLPKYIGQDDAVEVKWESSNTAAIEIVDGADQYTAKVTLQDEVTDVKLTISAGGASKDFTVRVDGFSAYTFIDHYSFPQMKQSISSDFDLDTSFTYQGRTATIGWEIDKQYSEYIALNEAKTGVIVTPAEDIKDVKIKATFTYNGESALATYQFSVAPALEHRQTVNKIHSVEGYPLELSGYIVHVFESSEQYGNATFYMIDDDFCSGYYLFRVKIDKTKADKFVEGAHVTVSGDTTKNYSGLWENNSGGTATVDDKAPIDPRDHIYAADTDVIAKTPSIVWRESTYVSLSGWQVSNVGTKPSSWTTGSKGTEGNILTLTRGDTSIAVYLNKYMGRTQEQLEAFGSVYDDIKVGDFVNVTGILGSHTNNANQTALDGLQILPVLASDITKVDAEGTNTDGAKVKAAVAQVAEKVKTNFNSLITAEKTVDMPTTVDGVTISYKVAGVDLKDVTVTIAADGKITVKPVDTEKNYDIEVTYKIGDYEGYSFFNIRNWKMSNEDLLAQVKETIEKLTIEDVKAAGAVTIPAFDALGATVTWAPKSGSPAWLTVNEGVVTVNSLPEADTTVTIVATIKLDDATETAELSFKVQKAPDEVFQALEAPAAGDYLYAAMHKGTRLYASKLELDGNYIATTEDVSAAVKLTIAKKSDTEWYIKMGTQYLEVNPYANNNNGVSYSLRLVATPTENAVWEWDNEIKIFKQKPVATEDGVTPATAYFYIGMRDNSDYTTMSPSDIKYITGSNAANLDVTQHPARLGTMVSASSVPEDEKAQQTLNALKTLSKTSFNTLNEEFELPTTPNTYNATIVWTVKDTTDLVTITNNVLKIVKLPTDADATVTLKLEVTVGNTTKTDDTITITVKKPAQYTGSGTLADPYTVADAIALAGTLESGSYLGGKDTPTEIYVKGYVVKVDGWSDQNNNWTNVFIADTKAADPTNIAVSAQVYRLALDGTYLKAKEDLIVGAEITIFGCLEAYKGKAEVSHNPSTGVNCKAVAYKAPDGGDTTDNQAKVNAAIAAVNATYEVSQTGDYMLPAAPEGVTFTWTSDNATYTIVNGNALDVKALPTDADVTVTLTLVATAGEDDEQKTATKTVTITIKKVSAAGEKGTTADNPYTVTEAITEITKLVPGPNNNAASFSAQAVYVQGYVVEAGTWSEDNNDWKAVYIADDTSGSAKSLQLYYLYPGDAQLLPLPGDLFNGAKITVNGYLQNFAYTAGSAGTLGTPEMSTHNQVNVTVVKYEATDKQKVEAAVAAIDMNNGSVTADIDLPASPVTGVSFAWEVEPRGTNATIENNNKVKITRTEQDANVTLKLTATKGNETANGTYTLKILSSSTPDATVIATLGFTANDITNDTSISAYDKTITATRGSYTFTIDCFNNNNKQWNLIKTGSKSKAVVGKISTPQMTQKITKIVVTIDSVSESNVNSFKLLVSDNSDFSGATEQSLSIKTGDNTFEIASAAANKYYRIAIDCKQGSSNGFVVVSKVVYWGYNA